MEELTYKPLQTQVPNTVRDAFKFYSIKVRKEKKLRDLCTEAAIAYNNSVRLGEIPPIDPELSRYKEEDQKWDAWTLHFEATVLKEIKKLCIDFEVDTYDYVTSMLIRYLREHDI